LSLPLIHEPGVPPCRRRTGRFHLDKILEEDVALGDSLTDLQLAEVADHALAHFRVERDHVFIKKSD
jgi:hypothetical protein